MLALIARAGNLTVWGERRTCHPTMWPPWLRPQAWPRRHPWRSCGRSAGPGEPGSLSTSGRPLQRSFHRLDLGLDEGNFLGAEPVLGVQLLVDLRDWLRPLDV